MSIRATWKGWLKVADLTCPVALYTAVSTSERVAFHLVDRKTMGRLRRHFVDGETGAPVERENQVKGYPTGDGAYVMIEPEEIAAALPESDKMLDVQAFVACDQLDDLFFDRPYYLSPAPEGVEAFAMLAQAMRARDCAAIARASLFRRIRTVVLRPFENGMIATTLNFDYEVRSAKEGFALPAKAKSSAEMLDLAEHIIATKRGEFDPAKFEDRYENAVAELVRAKLAGRKIKRIAPPEPTAPSGLMDALRLSLGKGSAVAAAPKPKSKPKSKPKPKPAAAPARRASRG